MLRAGSVKGALLRIRRIVSESALTLAPLQLPL